LNELIRVLASDLTTMVVAVLGAFLTSDIVRYIQTYFIKIDSTSLIKLIFLALVRSHKDKAIHQIFCKFAIHIIHRFSMKVREDIFLKNSLYLLFLQLQIFTNYLNTFINRDYYVLTNPPHISCFLFISGVIFVYLIFYDLKEFQLGSFYHFCQRYL
jgi:hypothetical protein